VVSKVYPKPNRRKINTALKSLESKSGWDPDFWSNLDPEILTGSGFGTDLDPAPFRMLKDRVVDPYPDWIRIQCLCGSGTVFGIPYTKNAFS
jgi:hypothetical protein